MPVCFQVFADAVDGENGGLGGNAWFLYNYLYFQLARCLRVGPRSHCTLDSTWPQRCSTRTPSLSDKHSKYDTLLLCAANVRLSNVSFEQNINQGGRPPFFIEASI